MIEAEARVKTEWLKDWPIDSGWLAVTASQTEYQVDYLSIYL